MKRILHVGWWTFEYRRAGGSIIHVETLMDELAKRGFSNVYFCGGRYNLLSARTYLKKWEKPFTTVYEVVNSPNLVFSYDTTPLHIRSKVIEELFSVVLDKEKPDIIHVHEVESLTGSLFTMARLRNIPCIANIHNYWYLCHRNILLDMTERVCTDFQDGAKCSLCQPLMLSSPVMWMYIGYFRNTFLSKVLDPLGKVVYRKLAKRHSSSKKFTPLPASIFKERRAFFVNELSRASAIIYPSKRTGEIYTQYGVQNSFSYVMLPVNNNYALIKPKQIPRPIKEKLVFGYLGGVIKIKGVHLIIEAAKLLAAYKDFFEVYIWGSGDALYMEELNKEVQELKLNITFRGPYAPANIQEVLDSIDVAIVPSICEETGPIVVNELKLSKTPIIGSRIGGIEEAIDHGKNGFLFEPGNVEELAGHMKQFIDNRSLVQSFMEAIDFSFDMNKYMDDLEKVYEHAIRRVRNSQHIATD